MIQIDHSVEPVFLNSYQVTAALNRARVRAGATQIPVIEKSDELWRNTEVTDKLHESHHGKCCYCERKRDRKREMDVEHYRPKGGVDNDEDHLGYWWLAFTWENLLWSCKTCNQKHKKTEFTLLPGGTRGYQEDHDLKIERPCLINPKNEDPIRFISFHHDSYGGRYFIRAIPRLGMSYNDTLRADETIRVVGLNRKEPGYDLIEERGKAVEGTSFFINVYNILRAKDALNSVDLEHRQAYLDIINSSSEKIKGYINSDRVFSGVYRDYLRRKNIGYENFLA